MERIKQVTISDFKSMEPMKYYDNPEPKTAGAISKRLSIISGDLSKNYIASRKFDGDWGCFIHYAEGHNLIRSRALSTVTGEYGNYTEKLPDLVKQMNEWPDETVLLGEICLAAPNQTANTIGTILRCKAPKAIERQKETPVEVHLFDILTLKGENLTNDHYENRLHLIKNLSFGPSFLPPEIYEDNFAENADRIISNGGEGLVLQLRTNPYMPGTRTAWKTLKLKQTMPHMELKVLRTLEPSRVYDGEAPEDWKFKDEDGTLVTKPYFYGWKNGVVVDYNGTETSVASGLSDDDRAYLATDEAQSLIKEGRLYAEVKAMQENSRGALRHPVLVRLRDDYYAN